MNALTRMHRYLKLCIKSLEICDLNAEGLYMVTRAEVMFPAFVCKRKKLCNCLSFFIFFLLGSALGRTDKRLLVMFQRLLPRTPVTSTRLLSFDKLKNDCIKMST